MNINEAEKLTGITKKTIRYYEEAGLLSVQRDENTGYRQFDDEDIKVLQEIRLYRNIGVSIEEIKAIMMKSCSPVEALINQMQQLNSQLEALKMKKELLESILNSSQLLQNRSDILYCFEDMLYFDTKVLKSKLAQLKKEDIILALLGASPQVNIFIQELLQEVNLQEEQKKLGRVKILEIEKAQLRIITFLNK
jgi:DNA-binding transcriptional MerR regulator